jgi:hypothetical protein
MFCKDYLRGSVEAEEALPFFDFVVRELLLQLAVELFVLVVVRQDVVVQLGPLGECVLCQQID